MSIRNTAGNYYFISVEPESTIYLKSTNNIRVSVLTIKYSIYDKI